MILYEAFNLSVGAVSSQRDEGSEEWATCTGGGHLLW